MSGRRRSNRWPNEKRCRPPGPPDHRLRPDAAWIDVPGAVDEDGAPVHRAGAAPVEGLHWMGLPWQTRLNSSTIDGVDRDARAVARRVSYDVIVLGAGSTGTNVAWYARDDDLTVAVVEDELVGGECSYWACMPSKALLGPTHALAAARRLPGAAQAVGEIDVAAVLARRDAFISHLDDASQVQWLASIDADLLRGTGRPRAVTARRPGVSVRAGPPPPRAGRVR